MSTNLPIGSGSSSGWNDYTVYPQPYTSTYVNWSYTMTDADVNRVADRVIEKLKSEVLGMLLEADPKAVAQLLLKAVEKE